MPTCDTHESLLISPHNVSTNHNNQDGVK